MKYINTIGFMIGMFIGALMGLSIAYWISIEMILNQNEAYDLGKKDAQKECYEFIKNSK